jgi:hypothetical protein
METPKFETKELSDGINHIHEIIEQLANGDKNIEMNIGMSLLCHLTMKNEINPMLVVKNYTEFFLERMESFFVPASKKDEREVKH